MIHNTYRWHARNKSLHLNSLLFYIFHYALLRDALYNETFALHRLTMCWRYFYFRCARLPVTFRLVTHNTTLFVYVIDRNQVFRFDVFGNYRHVRYITSPKKYNKKTRICCRNWSDLDITSISPREWYHTEMIYMDDPFSNQNLIMRISDIKQLNLK